MWTSHAHAHWRILEDGASEMVNAWNARLRLCFLAALFLVVPAQGALFQVHVVTTGASGEAVMAFDLNNSDPTTNHQVTISGFATDGTLLVCPPVPPVPVPPVNCTLPPFLISSPDSFPTGNVTGTLASDVVIIDAPVLDVDYNPIDYNPITYYQNILLGSFISFRFEMLGDPPSGSAPDGFSLTLMEPTEGTPILADDSLLFLFSFGAEPTCNTIEFSQVTRCTEVPSGNGVPEPSALALALAGLLGIGFARSKRIGRASVSASRG
jgi:hypothetical protein